MFTSRNIHFAILGIILGASSGYVLAFYQVQKSMPAAMPAPAGGGAAQASRPEVTTEELLGMFEKALARNPDNPELLTRYGAFLADIGRRAEAEKVLKQVEAIDPNYSGLSSLRQRLAAERGTRVP